MKPSYTSDRNLALVRPGTGLFLVEPEAKRLIADHGIRTPRFSVARSPNEAARQAESIGFPVVMKVISPQIVHKSDVGGVVTGIQNAEQVRAAYRRISSGIGSHLPDARIIGMLVEEMVPPSTEVAVGGMRVPPFGPVVMVGLGGVLIEVLNDVSFRVAPVSRSDALEMVTDLKAYPLLKGFRGSPPSDIDALLQVLLNVSALMLTRPDVMEST